MATRRTSAKLLFAAWSTVLACLCVLLGSPCAAYAVSARNPELLDDSVTGACRSKTFGDLLTPDVLSSDGPIGVAGSGAASAVTGDDDDVVLTTMSEGDEGEAETTSYLPLVMIVIGFSGQPDDGIDAHELPYDTTIDWSDKIYGGDWSVSKYYQDMSCGKFTFTPVQESSAYDEVTNLNQADQINDGVIHVTLESAKTTAWNYYDDVSADKEMLEAFSEAFTKAADYMEFADYDSNGDGAIQTSELAVCFVVAGKDAASHGGTIGSAEKEEYIWPHAWFFSDAQFEGRPDIPTPDGIEVDNYIAIAEYEKESVPEGVGVVCHELGHYLGLPDLYNTTNTPYGSWSSYSVFYLSLMDQGSYGIDPSGNERPFSLDMWSRVRLKWVEAQEIDVEDENSIAGSLCDPTTTDGVPLAVKVKTNRENEYYLIENRRFVSWDEELGNCFQYYSYAVNTDEEVEDGGGGLILWHIDDAIIEKYDATNTINNYGHHPGVMPLYFENDAEGNPTLIGSKSRYTDNKPFFDLDSWGRDVILPLYGTGRVDWPADRTQSISCVLALNSGSAPVMSFHQHDIVPSVRWDYSVPSATLRGLCYQCWKTVELETTTNVTSEVIKKPSSTETGVLALTAHFRTDGYTETANRTIPCLDEATLSERSEALIDLAELISQANAALAEGAYTIESFDALKEVIAEANAIFEDDTAVAEDVKAEKTKLILAWRLLEPVNSSGGEDAQQQAVCDLAEQLIGAYGNTDPEAYKPAAYEEFMEVIDRAYDVLENEDSTTAELKSVKTEVMRAKTRLEKNGKRIQIKAAVVSGLSDVTYNGKAYKPAPVVTLDGKALVAGTDFAVSYANNTNAGKATVKIVGTGDYTGKITKTFAIAKAANPLAAKGKTATVKLAKLNNKAQRLATNKVLAITKKGAGTMSYKKVSGSAKIVVSKKTGQVLVKKGLKKGTYAVKVQVEAAGDANHLASVLKPLTIKIKVG